MEDEGVELSRVVLSHIDECGFDMEYQKSIAKRGAYIAYDTFGSEIYFDSVGVHDPSDWERVEGVIDLIREGYVSQILLSQDIGYKIMLKQYGGYGYDHLLSHIVPMMLRKGVAQDQIDQMMIENPKRMLVG
jgi:phosphotriesterase-related protein